MKGKADVEDLRDMNAMKANKIDTENLMRCVDILHKHTQNIIVVLVELTKSMCSGSKLSEN